MKTIVIMDDSELVLAAVQATLEGHGFRVRVSTTLAELEAACAAGPFVSKERGVGALAARIGEILSAP